MPGGIPSTPGTPVVASATGAAAALAPALPAVPTKTNNLAGFEVTSGGANAASLINVTITGLLGGALTYVLAIPVGVALGATPLIVEFNPPLPAAAVNTAITVNVPSAGAGNTATAAVVHGYVA